MIQLDIHIIREYFEQLVQHHTRINHFVGFKEEELATLLTRKKSPEGLILALFQYNAGLKGNHQRTQASRTIHFAVLQYAKKGDYVQNSMALAECENAGLGVLSRIWYDSKKNICEWLYNRFDQNTVKFNEIPLKSHLGLVGMEFIFELSAAQPLTIDVNDWEDIDEI